MENLQNQEMPKENLRIKISSLSDPGMGNAIKDDLIESMRNALRKGGSVTITYPNDSQETFKASDELEKFFEEKKII